MDSVSDTLKCIDQDSARAGDVNALEALTLCAKQTAFFNARS
jgi:hypothetical protein